MSSVLVSRQILVLICKRNLCNGQRNWMNFFFGNRCRIFLCAGTVDLSPSRTSLWKWLLIRQQHVSSGELSESDEPVENAYKLYKKLKTGQKRLATENLHKINNVKEVFETLDKKLQEWIKEDRTLSDKDWDSLFDSECDGKETLILEYDGPVMISLCRKDLPDFALSFLKYVRKKKVPSLRTYTAVIAACGKKYPDIVFKEYEEMLNHYSSIDTDNYRYLIQGFSKTKEWKKCLEFLEAVKQIGGYTEFTPGLGMVIEAAVAHNDSDTVDYLLKTYDFRCGGSSLLLPQQFASAIFSGWSYGHIEGRLLLKYLSKYRGYLTLQQAQQLKQKLKWENGGEYHSSWGFIDRNHCSKCGEVLKGEPVTDSQVKLLEERLNTSVTATKHIYVYSTPDEFQKFSEWLKDERPFEIVIDAANYFYSYIPRICKKNGYFDMRVSKKGFEKLQGTDSDRLKQLLLATGSHVKEIQDQNGFPIWQLTGKRANMLRARAVIMKESKIAFEKLDKLVEPYKRILFVCNHGAIIRLLRDNYYFKDRYHLFIPQQKSDDDFFALAAALHSGANCYLLSGDNFTSLKLQMGSDIIPLFEQWQRRRQIFNSWNFIMPQDYDFCVQEDQCGWHVPYEKPVVGGQRSKYFMPNTVLCLRGKNRNKH